MLNVFAIDPKIGLDPEQFRSCILHCHPSNGRLIADLPPGSWSAETAECISQLADLLPKRRARLMRTLEKVRTQLVDRPRTNWDWLELSWIVNTENEHRREPFSLIISPDYEEPDDQELNYPPSELYPEVSAWNTPSGVQIKRSPGEFVKTILPMLRLAKRIHFVDRSFNIDNNRYIINYQQIIKKLAKYHNPSSSFPEELIIHCCPKEAEAPSREHFEKGLKKFYAHLIPTERSIKVFLWETKIIPPPGAHPFHNRYVLSEHCGVIIGYGTDSTEQDTDAPDTLQIVDESVYKKIWKIRKEKWPGVEIKEKFEISSE